MKRRFSSEELFILRNHIPIDILIEKELMIPTREDLEVFRFACPLCSKFNTGMLREKNLVRCFDCNKNFNTIEIVMEYKKKSFVESVKYLKQYLKVFIGEKDSNQSEGERVPIVKAADQKNPKKPLKASGLSIKNIGYRPRGERCKNPVQIGDILSTMLPAQSSEPLPTSTESDRRESPIDLTAKVLDLETKFESILDKLEKIECIINLK